MSALYEDIPLTKGHKFQHNGAGDYDWVCPTHGVKPGFVPYMYARIYGSGTCPLCGEQVQSAATDAPKE